MDIKARKKGNMAQLARLRDQIKEALESKADSDKALMLLFNDSLLKRSNKEPQEDSDNF
jgi:hypothetical protein